MSASVYAGTIAHQRRAVRRHGFRHRIALAYVDLEQPPRLPGRLVRFDPADYLSADRVRELTGAEGPVHVLTHLRAAGHCFNPVSFYFCGDAVVAEVTNTPWKERHAYVLSPGASDKRLHVSPYMGMDQTYDWEVSEPGETLDARISNLEDGERVFDAVLRLRRRPLTRRTLALHACSALRVGALIYAHAAVLRLKGIPWHPHPTPAP